MDIDACFSKGRYFRSLVPFTRNLLRCRLIPCGGHWSLGQSGVKVGVIARRLSAMGRWRKVARLSQLRRWDTKSSAVQRHRLVIMAWKRRQRSSGWRRN